MTQYFEQHTNSAPIYRQKLRRILDKNFDFHGLLGLMKKRVSWGRLTYIVPLLRKK